MNSLTVFPNYPVVSSCLSPHSAFLVSESMPQCTLGFSDSRFSRDSRATESLPGQWGGHHVPETRTGKVADVDDGLDSSRWGQICRSEEEGEPKPSCRQ